MFICDRYSLHLKKPMDILECKYLHNSLRLEVSGFQGYLLTFFTYFLISTSKSLKWSFESEMNCKVGNGPSTNEP